jgi:hypothetical protein
METFKNLKKTEELVNKSKNRYKMTVEIADLAKKHAYEFEKITESDLTDIEKPILLSLNQMIDKSY